MRRSPFWLKVLEVAVGVLFASALANWIVDGAPFATWLEATSTLAAVLAAMYAGLYAARAWTLEVEREERWADQQKLAQAAKVAAWPGGWIEGHIYNSETQLDEPGPLEGVKVFVRNASDVPVTDLFVEAILKINQASDRPMVITFIAERRITRLMVPAGEPVEMTLKADEPINPRVYVPGNIGPDWWCELRISFRDAAGQKWTRLADGQLLSK